MNLSINIQTRARPEALAHTLKHTLPNIGSPHTRVLICADEDDKATIDYLKSANFQDDRVTVSIKPREDTRGEKYQRSLTEAPGDVYLPHVDSVPILTPNFDLHITKAAKVWPDGVGCIYGPMANRSFPGFLCPTAKLVEKLGYIYSPEYPFWFIDHDLDDICRLIGRYAFVPVKADYQTGRPGKTWRMRDLTWWCNYYDASSYRRIMLAHNILERLDGPAWQKAMVKSWYPIVEQRSLAINDGVRGNALFTEAYRGDGTQPFDMEKFQEMKAEGKAEIYLRSRFENRTPPDDGYIRVFSKAQKKMREMNIEVAAVINKQKAVA